MLTLHCATLIRLATSAFRPQVGSAVYISIYGGSIALRARFWGLKVFCLLLILGGAGLKGPRARGVGRGTVTAVAGP